MTGYTLPVKNKVNYDTPVPKVNYNGLIFASVFNPVLTDNLGANKIHASGYFKKLKSLKRSWCLYTNNYNQINVVYHTGDRFKAIRNVGNTFGLLSFLNPFKALSSGLNGTFIKQPNTVSQSLDILDSSLDVDRRVINDDGVLHAWVSGSLAYILTKKGNILQSSDGFNYDAASVGQLESNIVRVNPGVITYVEYVNR